MPYDNYIKEQIESLSKRITKLLNEESCVKDLAEVKTYNRVMVYENPYVLEIVIKMSKVQ
jgi:hypothetical protein